MDWVNGLIIPVVKVVFIGGIVGWIGWIVFKAFHNAWSKQTKFFFKYKIMRKGYPEKTLKWCLDCIDQGIGYYDAKKMLFVNMLPESQIHETMWIYDQILNTMKGGMNNVGKFKANDRKDQRTELPSI